MEVLRAKVLVRGWRAALRGMTLYSALFLTVQCMPVSRSVPRLPVEKWPLPKTQSWIDQVQGHTEQTSRCFMLSERC